MLFVAACLAAWQVWEARGARKAQLLLDLTKRWDDPTFVEAREYAAKYEVGAPLRDAIKQFRENKAHEYFVLMRIPNFFEQLGLLRQERTVSLNVLNAWVGSIIIREWDRWELAVEYLRKLSSSTNYKMWQDLATKIQARRPTDQQPHPS